MPKEIVINTHIEKTAGTSLSVWFMKMYGKDRVLIYSPATDTLLRGTELPNQDIITDKVKTLLALTPLIVTAAEAASSYKASQERNHIQIEDLPHDFDVIHGHFEATRFNEVAQDPFMSIVLRDPLDRMISHYVNWRRREGKTYQRTEIAFDPEMSFKDFAMLPEMTNFQAQAIRGMHLEDFDLVGTTENMERFTQEYFIRRDLVGATPQLPDFNRTLLSPSHKSLGIDDKFIKVFRENNAYDYQLHSRATEII
jgi:hypothetical protein